MQSDLANNHKEASVHEVLQCDEARRSVLGNDAGSSILLLPYWLVNLPEKDYVLVPVIRGLLHCHGFRPLLDD